MFNFNNWNEGFGRVAEQMQQQAMQPQQQGLFSSLGSTIGGGIGSMGNAIGQGIGQVGGAMGNAFGDGGFGGGLRSGMADADLESGTIDALMGAGKWGLGAAALGGMMGGGQGAMNGLGMGLLGGGLGTYLRNNKAGDGKEKKGNWYENGLIDAMNSSSAAQPQFQAPQSPRPRASNWTPLDAYKSVGRI